MFSFAVLGKLTVEEFSLKFDINKDTLTILTFGHQNFLVSFEETHSLHHINYKTKLLVRSS